MTISKDEYTKGFLKAAGEVHNDAAVQEKIVEMWYNIRKSGGLRLTELGTTYLTTTLDLKSYQVKLSRNVDMTGSNLLILDRWIRCPYYVNLEKHLLVIYGHKQAFELKLYGDEMHVFFEKYDLTK